MTEQNQRSRKVRQRDKGDRATPYPRTVNRTRAVRARDGGWLDRPFVVPEPLISRDDRGIRCGPYEDNYDISHGYDAEPRIVDL